LLETPPSSRSKHCVAQNIAGPKDHKKVSDFSTARQNLDFLQVYKS